MLPRVRFISIGVIELSAFGYGCQAHCPISPPLSPTHSSNSDAAAAAAACVAGGLYSVLWLGVALIVSGL